MREKAVKPSLTDDDCILDKFILYAQFFLFVMQEEFIPEKTLKITEIDLIKIHK